MTMLRPELEAQSFGSSFDPVLTGVAHGLARLFPPIDDVCRSMRDADAPEQEICIRETEPEGRQSGNHRPS